MTLNGVIALILRFFTEFDYFAGQLRHSGWRMAYTVRKILSPSSSLPLLAITNPLPLQRGLCDSWAICFTSYAVLLLLFTFKQRYQVIIISYATDHFEDIVKWIKDKGVDSSINQSIYQSLFANAISQVNKNEML